MDPARLSELARISGEPLLRAAFVDVLVSIARVAVRTPTQHEVHSTNGVAFNEGRLLATFAVDHATSTFIGAPNFTKPILDEFYDRLWHAHFDRTGYIASAAAYAEAVAVPHHNGPGWQVGKVFAERCGSPGDFLVINRGYNIFIASYLAITEFILKVPGPDSPSIEDGKEPTPPGAA